MLVIGVAYVILGLSLLFESARWASTPAYHNLLVIMPQHAWAAVFLAASAGLFAGISRPAPRWLAIAALTYAIMVTTGWDAAFIVRWATNANTTPETWVSWAVFDFLVIRAVLLLDYREVRLPPAPKT